MMQDHAAYCMHAVVSSYGMRPPVVSWTLSLLPSSNLWESTAWRVKTRQVCAAPGNYEPTRGYSQMLWKARRVLKESCAWAPDTPFQDHMARLVFTRLATGQWQPVSACCGTSLFAAKICPLRTFIGLES